MRTTSVLTLHQKWPGLAQGLEITRERTVQGATTVEVEYAMTSLKPEEADAKRLAGLVREHWGIENRRSENCSSDILYATESAAYHSRGGLAGVGHMV